MVDHAMWFGAWPRIEPLPPHRRSLWVTSGDDTDLTCDELEQSGGVDDRFGTPIGRRVGDVTVICDHRFAHRRPSIHLGADEQRELGVLPGEPFERVRALDGRW